MCLGLVNSSDCETLVRIYIPTPRGRAFPVNCPSLEDLFSEQDFYINSEGTDMRAYYDKLIENIKNNNNIN